VRLRGHNLLCIQGFVGKGYSPDFVANMTRVVESLGEGAEVTVVDRPDVLCEACPNLLANGCGLHGEGTEQRIVHQDRDVMKRLGIAAGDTVTWGDVAARIASRIEPDDLDAICGACPWLPLGHCKAGIARLADGRVRTLPP
jgi:hypothetical protein